MKLGFTTSLLVCFVFTSFLFEVTSAGSDLVSTNCGDGSTMIAVSRKMKENSSGIRSNKNGDMGHVTLDDYRPIDPAPSSKASMKPKPIEHGSPLIPFIPKPSPPPHPKDGGSP